MPKRKVEDSLLVSAARVVGATLGRVKRLTIDSIEQATEKFEQATESGPGAQRKSSPPSTTGRAAGRSKKKVTSRKRSVRSRGKAILTGDDFDAATASPQEGGSRSPVRSESRRGKSRSKTSKSRSR